MGNKSGMTFDRLKKDLDNLLESAWSRGEKAWDQLGFGNAPFEPAVDVVESPEEVHVTVDLPGLQPEDVEISLVGNMLTIKGKREACCEANQGKSYLRERRCGAFIRSVSLPAPVDPDKVSAEFKHGVLTVKLVKAAVAQTRKIPINAGQPPL